MTKQYAIGSPEYVFDAVRQMVSDNIGEIDYSITQLRKSVKTCSLEGVHKKRGFVTDIVLAHDTIEDLKRHVFNTVGIVSLDETENLLRMIESRKQELRDITEVFESTCKCTK